LLYAVNIKEIPGACQLVLEQPNMYKSVRMNGKSYSFKSDGFYADHQFKTSKITDQLRKAGIPSNWSWILNRPLTPAAWQ